MHKSRRRWLPHALGAGLSALLAFLGGAAAEFLSDEVKNRFKPYNKWILGFFILVAVVETIRAFMAARTTEEKQPVEGQTGFSIGDNNQGNFQFAGGNITATQTQGDVIARDKVVQGDSFTGNKIINNYIQPNASISFNPLHQLPAAAELVGRDDEIRELMEKLEHGGVTISASVQGQGGIGKTALALVLANRLKSEYPDAQFFLDLRGVSDNPTTPAQAMAHVIRAYHPEAKLPDDEAALKANYLSVLYDKKALLVWDNARDKAQVEPLRPPDGCVMIVTSRQQFTLPWLYARQLKILPRDRSVALLRKIAPRIGDAADNIAQLCGDLPFALTIAASTIAERANLTVTNYVERLKAHRLKTLDGVAASLQLSYELLSEAQRQYWRALAVFPATFDDAAAAFVWDMEGDAANDELGEFIRFSLLEFDEEARRYRLHDLARDFARESLTEAEANDFALRHAQHYCNVMSKINELYEQGNYCLEVDNISMKGVGLHQINRGVSLFDLEYDNILAGQAWAANNSVDAERLGSLMELARLRRMSLRNLIKQLGLKPVPPPSCQM